MNYRLNVFGYPSADAAMLNVCLPDQRMVVEWTRDSIAAFGGDPDKMVLWGQSAGAGSAGYFAYAQYSDPLITGSNAKEGAAFGAFNESGLSPSQYENGFAVIGCPVSAETKRRGRGSAPRTARSCPRSSARTTSTTATRPPSSGT